MNFESLFSPLGVEHCAYFYYTTVISFVIFCVTIGAFVLSALQKKNKMNISHMIVLASQLLLVYFVNRLQYSMCVGSLH